VVEIRTIAPAEAMTATNLRGSRNGVCQREATTAGEHQGNLFIVPPDEAVAKQFGKIACLSG
jgi:hypothetical protein